jgi:hypothetical protein
MYFAYIDGRSDQDPSDKWYQGELNFFDGYLIPLAQKLKDCWRVFGISQSEFFQYATSNRLEWSLKGHQVLSNMKLRAMEKSIRRCLPPTDCVASDPMNDRALKNSTTSTATQDEDNSSLGDINDPTDKVSPIARAVEDSMLTESNLSHHSFQPQYIKQSYFE